MSFSISSFFGKLSSGNSWREITAIKSVIKAVLSTSSLNFRERLTAIKSVNNFLLFTSIIKTPLKVLYPTPRVYHNNFILSIANPAAVRIRDRAPLPGALAGEQKLFKIVSREGGKSGVAPAERRRFGAVIRWTDAARAREIDNSSGFVGLVRMRRTETASRHTDPRPTRYIFGALGVGPLFPAFTVLVAGPRMAGHR